MHKIKNQLTHLCCHQFYIQRLDEEVQKLEIERKMVQQAVDAALINHGSIRPDVKDWLIMANDWLITSHKILAKARQYRNSTTDKRRFLRWLPMVHYSLSVEAQKEVDASVQLQITPGRFDRVSDPLNPTNLLPVPPSSSEILLSSRALLEKQIMDALKDDVVYSIGLCGMGGVGKTTIAEKMAKWAKSFNIFEVVIFNVISQRLDIKKIQIRIAERLGLALAEHSQQVRAEIIHAKLKAAKSFLIILDDVWERLDLAELGIPSKNTTTKRKIIITSRNRDALTTLTNDCHRIFTVDILTDEEAWELFSEKASYSIEEPELVKTKKQVAEQCKGLPMALRSIASALRGRSKSLWEDALVQLKRSPWTSYIPGLVEDLYEPLKWSYDQLPSEEFRYIFLLCCLFPKDVEIPIEMLVRYGWSLGIFNEIQTIREARDKVSFLVDVLKCRFLLTQAKSKPFFGTGESVKVHNVLREIGIWIACNDRYRFMVSHRNWKYYYENATHIYVELNGKPDLPETLICPRLEFLHIRLHSDFEGDIPKKFFSSKERLKVLSTCMFKTTKLPSSITELTNLQGIYLEDCQLGKMESVFENMVKLEIISLRGSRLEVLPREIGRLKYLRVLDLTYCEIISIECGVISRLVKLQELLMLDCKFWKEEVEEEEEEERMMVLEDIGSLSNLVNLQIKLSNPKILSLHQPFRPKLERFILLLARHEQYLNFEDIEDYALYNKVAVISYTEAVPIMNFILTMIMNTECLRIEGAVPTQNYNTHDDQFFFNKKIMCPDLKKLILSNINCNGIFSSDTPKENFNSLEVLRISHCKNLKNVIAPSLSKSLKNLKRLCIEDCEELEEVIMPDKDQEVQRNITEILFPQLEKLELLELPMMYTFCHMIDDIEFPSLEVVSIQGCPLLKTFSLGFPSFPKIKVRDIQDPDLLSEFNTETSP